MSYAVKDAQRQFLYVQYDAGTEQDGYLRFTIEELKHAQAFYESLDAPWKILVRVRGDNGFILATKP